MLQDHVWLESTQLIQEFEKKRQGSGRMVRGSIHFLILYTDDMPNMHFKDTSDTSSSLNGVRREEGSSFDQHKTNRSQTNRTPYDPTHDGLM